MNVSVSNINVRLDGTYRNDSGEPVSSISLDCHGLMEVVSVQQATASVPCSIEEKNFVAHSASISSDATDVEFNHIKDDNTLVVTLSEPLAAGAQVVLRSVTNATPTDHILEGVYLDRQVGDADVNPRNLMSQCQQYGFQRIAPTVDRMAAKTFYTTVVVADKRCVLRRGFLSIAWRSRAVLFLLSLLCDMQRFAYRIVSYRVVSYRITC